MKLVIATALPLLAKAAYEDIVNDYCSNTSTSWNASVSDPEACRALLNTDGPAKEGTQACIDKGDMSPGSDCMGNLIASLEDDDDFATSEFATDEFLNGIGDDPMLQNVLAEMNSLEAYLESAGVTRRVSDCEAPGMSAEDKENCLKNNADADAAAASTNDQVDAVNSLKRFVELKQLVSWLQPKDKRISRYCFYGCWCLPEGAHSFVAGEGRPVDLVDKACQYLWFCYTCAKQEFRGVFLGKTKECTPDKQKYSFRFRYDKAHPAHYEKRDIICKDTFYNPMNSKDKWKSNCARAICECDRGLAKRLWRAWTHWDKSRHRIWSQKVTSCKQLSDCALISDVNERAACVKRGCLFIVKRRCLNGVSPGFSPDHAEICCGLYEDEGGRMEMRDHGGTHACCNHDQGTGNGNAYPWAGNWYNTITHCCSNGKVFSAASPSC